MRISRVLSLAIAAFTLNAAVVSSDAFAKKEKASAEASGPLEIQETKIASFDDTFGKVKDLQAKLTLMNTNMVGANDKITEALGLPKGTPVADALADLKAKAGDTLTVALDGDKPKLTVADAAPENVKSAVTAANDAVNMWMAAAKDATTLQSDLMAIKDEAAALPGKTPDAVKEAGLPVTELPKVTKAVNNNLKATMQTVDMAKMVVESLGANIQTLKGFAG